MWPSDTFPTENGGHTYLAFITIKEPTLFCKGLVRPVPDTNFKFLTEECKEYLREGFKKKGYILEG